MLGLVIIAAGAPLSMVLAAGPARLEVAALPAAGTARLTEEPEPGRRAPVLSLSISPRSWAERLDAWLAGSARDFQGPIMLRLSVPSGSDHRAAPAVRLAQAGKTAVPIPVSRPQASPMLDALAPVTDWVEKSAQDFQSIIMRRLSVPSVQATPAAPAVRPLPTVPTASGGGLLPSLADRLGGAAQSARDWLAQSKRDFQERIVGGITKAEPQTLAAAPPAPKQGDDAVRRKAEDDARAAQAAIEAAERKVREQRAEEERRKAATAASAAEQSAAAAREADAEARRRKAVIEESARKAAAEQRRAEEAAAAVATAAANSRLKAQTEAVERKAAEARQRQKAEQLAGDASREADGLLGQLRPDKTPETATARAAAGAVPPASANKLAEPSLNTSAAPAQSVGPAAALVHAEPREQPRKVAAAERDGTSSTAENRAGPDRRARKARRERACKGAGRRVRPPAAYVVARGDSLWTITRRHYRHGVRWVAVYKANGDKIADPDLIYPCQRFHMPKL